MLSVRKDYFEELLESAANNRILDFSREEAETLINKYFPRKEFVGKKEAARFLDCSSRQLDYLRENHGLPWFQQGNTIKFSIYEIRKWMLERQRCGSGSVPSLSYQRKDSSHGLCIKTQEQEDP